MPIDHTKNWWLVYYDYGFDNTLDIIRITGPYDSDTAWGLECSYDGPGYVTAHQQERIKNDY